MYRTIISSSFGCALLILSVACAETNQTSNTVAPAASPAATGSPSPAAASAGKASPSAAVVRARAAPVEMRAGGAAEASVRLDIDERFHINANPPTHSYLIATQLEVAPAEGVTAGKPAYPTPLKKKFAFDPVPLAVYEKEATIRLPLRAAAGASQGTRTLRVKVRVQPCDDQACYPPRTVETEIPLTIN
ncbi:MAG: protein-disulfide reductase DsbD domain-containing protein [Pyrinomonadaceae bacterium]